MNTMKFDHDKIPFTYESTNVFFNFGAFGSLRITQDLQGVRILTEREFEGEKLVGEFKISAFELNIVDRVPEEEKGFYGIRMKILYGLEALEPGVPGLLYLFFRAIELKRYTDDGSKVSFVGGK